MAHNIDPKGEGIVKGILPTHMRQGMPPYLQILFAARPKLPFVDPIKKPHPIKVNGFFDKLDLKAMKAKSDQLRQQKLNQTVEVPETAKKELLVEFRETLEKENMEEQIREPPEGTEEGVQEMDDGKGSEERQQDRRSKEHPDSLQPG